MSKVKYGEPFAMGNLDDLMRARETDDLEYLKEWSRKAVEAHEKAIHIQHKAFEKLIEIQKESSKSVTEVHTMLKDYHAWTKMQSSERSEKQ